ncbi:MAG: hypothetical protein MZV65_15470 [Chromatiales bacterium]|nr:hypothetical protein [Chromatiales bacterium]
MVGTWKNGFIVLHDGPAPRGGPERGPAQPAAGRGPADPGRAAAGGGGTGGDGGATRLRWLVSRIDQSRPYYLLGEVEIADGRGPALTGRLDSVESYNPAPLSGRDSRACTTPAPRNWGRGSISWPSGARWWCSSGSGPARRR